MRQFQHALFLLFFAHASMSAEVRGDHWPQFRGPDGNGAIPSLSHPVNWKVDADQKENVAWTAEIAGGGWSSAVSAGDRIFVTTAVSKEAGKPKGFSDGVASMRTFFKSKPPQTPFSFEVHCLRLSDGHRLWKRTIDKRKVAYAIHPSNSYATESPVTDGKRVYVSFAAVGLVACLNLEGNEVWRRELGVYPTSNNFGTGSSLTMFGGRVFIQCDNQKKSFLKALDAESGKEVWSVDRKAGTCWSTPLLWKNRVRAELVVCGPGNVVSHDPASGKVLWSLEGMGGSFSSSPATDSDRI